MRILWLVILLFYHLCVFSANGEDKSFRLEDGTFGLGVNYWSSHAGISMWRNWNPEVVDNDLKKLSEIGINVLRIFPLWSDFQPIKAARNASGRIVDFRFDESPLPDTPLGQSGISEEMISHLKELLKIGEKYNISFIVSLVTGHMSGRVYTPEVLDGLNPLTDPLALKWEIQFVKSIVSELKNCENIIGWGLGNESNCMGGVSKEQAFVWSSLIANTIRSVDNNRPVLSDMHGLSPTGTWSIIDQGYITDMLTTHPYPLFTANCNYEPINTIRPLMHGIAESTYYRGISGKPVLIEEMGSLGPMLANEQITADFFRVATFSSWVHGFYSSMWWCNSDFEDIYDAPYDWNSFEAELGIFKSDGAPKLIVDEFRKIHSFLDRFPYKELPDLRYDGVALVSSWEQAQSSFILAKQAGYNIDFQYVEQKLKKSHLYMLPSLRNISKSRMRDLMSEVKKGATLYMSIGDLHLGNFSDYTGLKINAKYDERRSYEFDMGKKHFSISSPVSIDCELRDGEVILKDKNGRIVLSHYQYGEGNVYVLMVPLEECLASMGNSFTMDNMPFYELYKLIFQRSLTGKHLLSKSNPLLGVTEHWIDSNNCIAVFINYSPKILVDKVSLDQKWRVKKRFLGDEFVDSDKVLNIVLPPNEVMVIELSKD